MPIINKRIYHLPLSKCAVTPLLQPRSSGSSLLPVAALWHPHIHSSSTRPLPSPEKGTQPSQIVWAPNRHRVFQLCRPELESGRRTLPATVAPFVCKLRNAPDRALLLRRQCKQA